ncbi:MAG TPA: hypothetical protein VD883_01935 [Candidatus Omnitrophota bacterium]|nr:hypothetical protein [Candidatus Omnitrophota bacterium]
MGWSDWIPWRYFLRRLAKSKGFVDPTKIAAQLKLFAQPSEVAVPLEIMRLTAALHTRGLMNAQAIQHNLDWVWPYWVERQFDPQDRSFVPRAFSLTHINLTHRNWTAVGLPDVPEMPIVDPRGLLTPFYDGWSLDAWVILPDRQDLIPSRLGTAVQKLTYEKDLGVQTDTRHEHAFLETLADVVMCTDAPVCRYRVRSRTDQKAWIAVSLRPTNPEGVSFIYDIAALEGQKGWRVDKKGFIYFSHAPDAHSFSKYREGDVFRKVPYSDHRSHISCEIGMASAAALYELKPNEERNIEFRIPLRESRESRDREYYCVGGENDFYWKNALQGAAKAQLPDDHFRFLYDAAVRTVTLFSPKEVYAGPYTYKHFWFRDAAMILNALCSVGLFDRAERIIDSFPSRQTPLGYFRSQDGEWDSNGQAIWLMRQFCELSGRDPKPAWIAAAKKGAKWIQRKRVSEKISKPHAGLLPAGFSAEHLGPNDFYYWDDFWGVAGLLSAAWMLRKAGEEETALEFEKEGERFLACVDRSLKSVNQSLGHLAMPASPYRRLDTGMIGSLAVGYPLNLWPADDPRVLASANYIFQNYFVKGGFFHDMSHSGINPYLTLHVAQIYLRAGDRRFYAILKSLAELSSSTGQWPEAIHPETRGGCMGDGQHGWAAAEWILAQRNAFVREEGSTLVLFSGIPPAWLENGARLTFGPAPTRFGSIDLVLEARERTIHASWNAKWHTSPPGIFLAVPGHGLYRVPDGRTAVELPRGGSAP